MASYTLQSSYDTVQVISPSEVIDAIFCTIQTDGHGAILNRTIPKNTFGVGGRDSGLLNSLATAVDEILDGGLASSAYGVQDVDATNLLVDAVVFTVEYLPTNATLGPLTTTVTIPVNILTADTQFGSFLTGGSAQDQLAAAIDNLRKLSGD